MAPLTLAPAQRRSYAAPLGLAALVLAAVAAALFYFNPHHTADLTVTHIDLLAPRATFKAPAGSLHIIGQAPYVEQDLYVVVSVHLQDDLRLPLFIDDVDAHYTGADSTAIDTVSPSAADLQRTEDIFPQLKPLLPHPLSMGDTVPPQSAVNGQVLLHFGTLSEHDWQTRKPSSLTIHFTHQDPITVPLR